MNDNLTLHDVREVNRKNILKSLLNCDRDIRRDELAMENGISVMTVKKIIAEFLSCKIVEEKDLQSTVGRRPKVLKIADLYGAIACVSLTSNEYFSYKIIDFHKNILEERQLIIQEQFSYKENLLQMEKNLQKDLEKTGLICVGICLSVPSAYYEEEDMVNCDLIPDFFNLHLKKEFQNFFGIKNVSVVHDVFAAAQAEYNNICHANESLFYFYVGYGVGGAYINENGWQNGYDLVAGEIGQILYQIHGEERTLESLVSIPGILEQIKNECGQSINFYEAMSQYKRGNTGVKKIIDEAVLKISRVVYNISWIINPTYIIIGGIYSSFIRLVVDSCNLYNQRMKKLPIRNSVQVRPSVLKDGETEGCYNIILEQWIDNVASGICEQEGQTGKKEYSYG